MRRDPVCLSYCIHWAARHCFKIPLISGSHLVHIYSTPRAFVDECTNWGKAASGGSAAVFVSVVEGSLVRDNL